MKKPIFVFLVLYRWYLKEFTLLQWITINSRQSHFSIAWLELALSKQLLSMCLCVSFDLLDEVMLQVSIWTSEHSVCDADLPSKHRQCWSYLPRQPQDAAEGKCLVALMNYYNATFTSKPPVAWLLIELLMSSSFLSTRQETDCKQHLQINSISSSCKMF